MGDFVELSKRLREVCGNCGFTLGSHCAGAYYSRVYKRHIPYNCCPGHEDRMDWDEGQGTIFKSTGRYKEEEENKNEHTNNSE